MRKCAAVQMHIIFGRASCTRCPCSTSRYGFFRSPGLDTLRDLLTAVEKYDMSTLRVCLSGAAPLGGTLVKQVGVVILQETQCLTSGRSEIVS